MNILEHDGYLAEIELDEDAGMLFGIVINTRDTLHFTAPTIPELKREFARTVEVYIDWCNERGKPPEKPYSGKFQLRLDPGLHARAAAAAARLGKSLNAFVAEAVEKVA